MAHLGGMDNGDREEDGESRMRNGIMGNGKIWGARNGMFGGTGPQASRGDPQKDRDEAWMRPGCSQDGRVGPMETLMSVDLRFARGEKRETLKADNLTGSVGA